MPEPITGITAVLSAAKAERWCPVHADDFVHFTGMLSTESGELIDAPPEAIEADYGPYAMRWTVALPRHEVTNPFAIGQGVGDMICNAMENRDFPQRHAVRAAAFVAQAIHQHVHTSAQVGAKRADRASGSTPC